MQTSVCVESLEVCILDHHQITNRRALSFFKQANRKFLFQHFCVCLMKYLAPSCVFLAPWLSIPYYVEPPVKLSTVGSRAFLFAASHNCRATAKHFVL